MQFYPGDPLQSGPQAIVGVMELPVGYPVHTHTETVVLMTWHLGTVRFLSMTVSVWYCLTYCRISIWLSNTSLSSLNCFMSSSSLQKQQLLSLFTKTSVKAENFSQQLISWSTLSSHLFHDSQEVIQKQQCKHWDSQSYPAVASVAKRLSWISNCVCVCEVSPGYPVSAVTKRKHPRDHQEEAGPLALCMSLQLNFTTVRFDKQTEARVIK